MVHSAALVTAAASLLLAHPARAQGLYGKNSAVVQISGMDYDRVVAKSNYTSIVEFYAPWCGHCKNLKPAYEAAAKSLAGIAKVVAVNCDDEVNKPFCGRMGVQGFPTLKIVRPSKKPGKPTVEDYQGPRAAKGIVEAVKDKIPNNVKRVTEKNLDEWLSENNDTAKAILFSDKGIVPATLRTLAIDFAGIVSVAQIRNKETKAMDMFGIEKVPTLVLLPGGSKEPLLYSGDMKKEGMVEFLSQIAPPNPDCPPPKSKKTKPKKEDKSSAKPSKSSTTAKDAESETIVEEKETPTPGPAPVEETKPTVPVLSEESELVNACLNVKSKTCVLALLPKGTIADSEPEVLTTLASIHKKHDARAGHLFPFFGVAATNPLYGSLVSELKLGESSGIQLIATNAKRGWWKKYSGEGFGIVEVEAWIDTIRMGEGKKEKLPDAVLTEGETEPEVKKEKPNAQEPIQIEIEELPDEDEQKAPGHSEL